MARIRTIKPTFWTSEQIVECSPIARLLFIGIWNFCDDAGNMPASFRTLKMQVFPGDDFTIDDIEKWIDELKRQGLVVEYMAENKAFWHVTGWHHQKVDRPNFVYPKPKFVDHSTSDRGQIAEQSPPEGKVKEGKVREGSVSAHAHEKAAELSKKIETSESPTPPTWQDRPADEFAEIHAKVVDYARPDDFRLLRDWCNITRYDPAAHGPVADEVSKFVSHYLSDSNPGDRSRFIANPVAYFQRKFPGWLTNAKTMNRRSKSPPPSSAKSRNWNINLEQAKSLAKAAHGGFYLELTDRDYGWPLQAGTEAEFYERLAKKVKEKTERADLRPSGNKGETTISGVLANFKPKATA